MSNSTGHQSGRLPLKRPRLRLSELKRLVKVCLGRDLFLREQLAVRRERHGSEYGGWWIHPDPLGPQSVVYSFGIGDDITFDRSMIETFGLCVHAFDPTPRSVAWIRGQDLPARFLFHPIGLADFDGEAEFLPPAHPAHMSYSIQVAEAASATKDSEVVPGMVRRLVSIMSLLRHEKVDLLKMDIEGAEYPVIRDILRGGIAPEQLLVEFHHGYRDHTTRQTRDAVRQLNAAGYRIFSISRTGREYSFIRCR